MQARKRRMAEKAAVGEIEDTEVRFLSIIIYHLFYYYKKIFYLYIYLYR